MIESIGSCGAASPYAADSWHQALPFLLSALGHRGRGAMPVVSRCLLPLEASSQAHLEVSRGGRRDQGPWAAPYRSERPDRANLPKGWPHVRVRQRDIAQGCDVSKHRPSPSSAREGSGARGCSSGSRRRKAGTPARGVPVHRQLKAWVADTAPGGAICSASGPPGRPPPRGCRQVTRSLTRAPLAC